MAYIYIFIIEFTKLHGSQCNFRNHLWKIDTNRYGNNARFSYCVSKEILYTSMLIINLSIVCPSTLLSPYYCTILLDKICPNLILALVSYSVIFLFVVMGRGCFDRRRRCIRWRLMLRGYSWLLRSFRHMRGHRHLAWWWCGRGAWRRHEIFIARIVSTSAMPMIRYLCGRWFRRNVIWAKCEMIRSVMVPLTALVQWRCSFCSRIMLRPGVCTSFLLNEITIVVRT